MKKGTALFKEMMSLFCYLLTICWNLPNVNEKSIVTLMRHRKEAGMKRSHWLKDFGTIVPLILMMTAAPLHADEIVGCISLLNTSGKAFVARVDGYPQNFWNISAERKYEDDPNSNYLVVDKKPIVARGANKEIPLRIQPDYQYFWSYNATARGPYGDCPGTIYVTVVGGARVY